MVEQEPLIPPGPGERLRQAREKKKITLADAARQLRVPADILESIETGMAQGIPAVYLKGYLQNYSRFLGLTEGEARQVFEGVKLQTPELESVFPQTRRTRTDRYLKAFSYVLASLLVGTLAWQATHEAVRLSQGDDPAPAGLPQDGKDGSGMPASQTRPFVHASIASLEDFRSRYATGPRGAGEQAWSAVDGDGPAEDAQHALELAEGESQLTLAASADSWIEITDADSKRLEMDLVRGGSVKHYQGRPPFTVLLGRSTAIEVFIDGQAVNLAPYTQGDVTQGTIGAPDMTAATDGADPEQG